MILINLLPPELRRRKAEFQFNPMMAGAAGGLVAVLLMVGVFFWVKGRLEIANQTLDQRNEDLAMKTAQAAAVAEREALIAAFESRRDTLFGLLGRKMYWARTIDEFSKQLTGEWNESGFRVSAGDLTVSELPSTGERRGGAEEVRASFRWRYKIVGDVNQKSGDYIKSFFKTIEKGEFWSGQGFVGKPEERYDGDRPRWNDDIKKVIVEGGLDWQRVKLAEFMKKGAKAPQGN